MDKKVILLLSGVTVVALCAFASGQAFSKKNDAATLQATQSASTSIPETKETSISESPSTQTDSRKSSVLQQLEEEREQKLEDDRNKAEHDKLIAKQEASPECKFWRLQKIKKPTPKVDEQINAHCGIPVVTPPQK